MILNFCFKFKYSKKLHLFSFIIKSFSKIIYFLFLNYALLKITKKVNNSFFLLIEEIFF